MKLKLNAQEAIFQSEVRAFLAQNLPIIISEKVFAGLRLEKDEQLDWQKTLYQQGWAAESWPHVYGGTGWTSMQKYIWAEESALAGAPDIIPFGLNLVGPVIYTYGTEEQKQRFLPDILASETWWCQGFSEPEAGSDLASLQTTAVLDGDHYLVNGTKTWITLAQYADWMFCLIRTRPASENDAKSISFLLIPMDLAGLTVKPIITMDGSHEMNEVHFDNVKVPVANLIGKEGDGWTYAKFLLKNERAVLAHVPRSKSRLANLKKLAVKLPSKKSNLLGDPYFAAKIAKLEIELNSLEFANFQLLANDNRKKVPGPESSILKIIGTEIEKTIDELFMEVVGPCSLPFTYDSTDSGQEMSKIMTNTAQVYFNGRKASLFGGSSEIQKNIICKELLGLEQGLSGVQK